MHPESQSLSGCIIFFNFNVNFMLAGFSSHFVLFCFFPEPKGIAAGDKNNKQSAGKFCNKR